MNPLREISPNSGAYWNECDYLEPNWEEAFWGADNYARLKTIKEEYDPTGMFRVWNGVGGLRPETGSELAGSVIMTFATTVCATLMILLQ